MIGYNNEQAYWLAKNSWGSGFADGGYFKVAFGAAGVCDEARGLIFTPPNPPPIPVARVKPSMSKPGCYSYRATTWDYVSKVATMFKMSPRIVLLDNVNVIPDPAMLLGGLTVVVCGIGEVPGLPRDPRVGRMSQLDALLYIKLAIDPDDVLNPWERRYGVSSSYCNWIFIECDENKNVVSIEPGGGLNGVLPDVSALQALPKLVTLNLGVGGLQGTLPADWSAVRNLQKLYLGNNQLWGSLPARWSAMRNLQVLYLHANKLSGPLPAAWGSMASLKELSLGVNQFSGALPAEWSRMGNMVKLWFHKNKLSGLLPGQWSAMTKLKVLYLANNNLTGLLPPEWGRLAELHELDFTRNKLSGLLPGQWGNMAKLVTLGLGGNQLSGVVPAAQWKGMTSLRLIGLWYNSQLSGCLPAAWKGRVNVPGSNESDIAEPSDAYGPDSGTKVTGFCP